MPLPVRPYLHLALSLLIGALLAGPLPARAQAPKNLFDALIHPAPARKPVAKRPARKRMTVQPAKKPAPEQPAKPAAPVPPEKPAAAPVVPGPARVALPADAWNDATRAAMFAPDRLVPLDDYPQLGAHLKPAMPAPAEPEAPPPGPPPQQAGPAIAVPIPRPKGEPAEATLPPPAAEPDPDCADLQAAGVVGTLAEPIEPTPAGCGIPHPVAFTAVDTPVGRVELKPAGIMRCGAAKAVAAWVREDVARLGQDLLSADLKALHTASSYVCRPRNNVAGAVLSEHGRGTALDVSGFEFADGRTFTVGGKADDKGFVQAVRKAACTHLTTVLGPGTDAEHGNHLHVDLKIRKGGYRICE